MGILALIRLCLQAFLELSSDVKLSIAAWNKNQEAAFQASKARALQDIKSAITVEEYQNAAREIHDQLMRL